MYLLKLESKFYQRVIPALLLCHQELIHAVLCEDVELARTVLWANPGLSVNIRFRVHATSIPHLSIIP